MDERVEQIKYYIQQAQLSGVQPATMAQSLRQVGWPDTLITEAFRQMGVDPNMTNPVTFKPSLTAEQRAHSRKVGLVWLLGPFALLIGIILVQSAFHAIGIHSAVMNILTLLIGLVTVPLMIIGPIIGIYKLTEK